MKKVNSEMIFSTDKANNHVRKRVPQQKLTETFAKELKREHRGRFFQILLWSCEGSEKKK